ncbi:autotransporter assembly complex family protein [Rhodanobacter sp. MP7CTX1]|uniref:autotransporter assembly complex protein TamA n=1 Tax=Rhodanobacter sp. MP7CTX1 TaxID=2723084 RepID=UPI00161879C9|nr:autotransporter assembly complex family protein [Rhodanobacter sp. MP7CTX1]MBB6186340.1 translocation and assembly module TamA [Rhodanobacter sp. MP7CTX1]
MRRSRRRLCLLPLLLIPAWAHAGVQLVVDGVEDPLKAAVVAGVDLSQYANRDASEAQVRRLYANAEAQVRTSLEPYGYYDASVTGKLEQVGKDWHVSLHVVTGQPVMVTSVDIELDKSASDLKPVRQARRAVEQLNGQQLDDGAYDRARDTLSGALTANGFLDARLLVHRVEVHSAQHTATIHLAWELGRRYHFGQVHFEGSQFREGFLKRYIPFKPGDYFDQAKLLLLQQALNGADYFSIVNVMPDVDNASNGTVDVNVQLAPAKRTIYTGGLFLGTDTGYGVRGGIEMRWINRRGHKWKNEIVVAQRLKTVSTVYSIPLPGDNQRSFNYGASYRDSDTDTSQSRTFELTANETALWHNWVRTVGLHAISGTFDVGKRPDEPESTPGVAHGASTLVYAEGSLTRKQADNFNFVQRGWSLSFNARTTLDDLISSASFSQLTADAKWIRGFAGNNRLILRASIGHIWTDDFSALPPQLRFFAGGDNSVRGYSYQSIGPENAYGRVIGGNNLIVASSEVEHYFTQQWGMAVFVDAGNAFDGTTFTPRIGTGLGVRWRSPVGLVRVDVGTPVNDSQRHGLELHLVIGPDL